jgi:hypothetical protein
MRVLDPSRVVFAIDELGLCEHGMNRIQHWFASLGGMFIVGGPVGSGKTTTLYSLLHALRWPRCGGFAWRVPHCHRVPPLLEHPPRIRRNPPESKRCL